MTEERAIIGSWTLMLTDEDGRPREYHHHNGKLVVRRMDDGRWQPFLQPNRAGSFVPLASRWMVLQNALTVAEAFDR